jgi:hypothetical protein
VGNTSNKQNIEAKNGCEKKEIDFKNKNKR